MCAANVLEQNRNEQDGELNDSHLMPNQDRVVVGSLADSCAPDLQNKNCNAGQGSDNLRENTGEVAVDDQFSLEYSAYLQQFKNNPQTRPESPSLPHSQRR